MRSGLFDELTGDGKVPDVSGNGHDGEINGDPTLETGAVNNAIRFDADEELVIVPDDNALDFSASDSYTINLWVKPEHIDAGGYHGIIQKGGAPWEMSGMAFTSATGIWTTAAASTTPWSVIPPC